MVVDDEELELINFRKERERMDIVNLALELELKKLRIRESILESRLEI